MKGNELIDSADVERKLYLFDHMRDVANENDTICVPILIMALVWTKASAQNLL